MSKSTNALLKAPVLKTKSRTRLCVYELYKPCTRWGCRFQHRTGMVFNERQTIIREYIRANNICVAFMLFGKCSHKYKNNARHTNIHTVRGNIHFNSNTRVEQQPVTNNNNDYALTEQQIMVMKLKISELQEQITAYRNTISQLVEGLKTIECSVSQDQSTQTDPPPVYDEVTDNDIRHPPLCMFQIPSDDDSQSDYYVGRSRNSSIGSYYDGDPALDLCGYVDYDDY